MNNIFWNIWNFENERNDNMAKLSEKELPKYYVKETGDYYCLYEKEGNKYLGRLSSSGRQDLPFTVTLPINRRRMRFEYLLNCSCRRWHSLFRSRLFYRTHSRLFLR